MTSQQPVESAPAVVVENRGCKIERLGTDALRCSVSGKTGTWVMFLLGIAQIYGSIGLIAWHLSKGLLEPITLSAGFLTLALGLFMQWRGMRRHREIGSYLIDRGEQEVRKEESVYGYAFDDVVYVRLAVDIFDLTRLDLFPRFPRWMFVHFRDGRQFRIGRGGKNELKPVLVWLKKSGLPVSLDED